jgi:hypothetical protein
LGGGGKGASYTSDYLHHCTLKMRNQYQLAANEVGVLNVQRCK